MSTERVSVTEFRGEPPSNGGRGVQRSVNTVCPWIGLDFWPLFPEKKAFGHEAFGHASALTPVAELVTEQDDALVALPQSLVDSSLLTRTGLTCKLPVAVNVDDVPLGLFAVNGVKPIGDGALQAPAEHPYSHD